VGRDGAVEDGARCHDGHQRLHDRLLENPRAGVDQEQHVDGGEARARQRGNEHQAGRRAKRDRVAEAQYQAAVVTVGHLSGRQHQEKRR
jgi:hypothetical protein